MFNRTALLAAALCAIPLSVAFADRLPDDSERQAIADTLGSAGYSAWGEIEWDDDGYWEVDNAVGGDGKRYDIKLGKSLNIIGTEIDD
jgi:hypothetical protein